MQTRISKRTTFRKSLQLAKQLWPGQIHKILAEKLWTLNDRFLLSVVDGDLQLLNGNWYVNHSGLLRLAHSKGCSGIKVHPVRQFCDPTSGRFAFEATVYRNEKCRGFVGYGDAEPSNVSPVVHGAEMRVAETRAVNRALRKAYGIGICSVEELGSCAESRQSPPQAKKLPVQPTNGNYGGPRVRDRLCQIIRQHQLDANLVKSYAIDFCGTKTLREATREQVEGFVTHLADWAEKDRNALLCQLNSYFRPKEGAA
jgi:hypothetical protein